MVLCVDETVADSGRTQPRLPMGLGHVEGYTHDYVRHGTTCSSTGAVQCRKRHRHEEFLSFLRLIDREVPADGHPPGWTGRTSRQVKQELAAPRASGMGRRLLAG